MTRFRQFVAVALQAAALATPALALDEWYDYYVAAVDRQIPSKQYTQALESLKAAARLKENSGINVRTYGMEFVPAYVPYYHQGVCYLRLGDFNSAIRLFNIEEKQGAIRKNETLYRSLQHQRNEAETALRDAEQQRRIRLVRDEVSRLTKEATELRDRKKYEDALSRLAQAQKAAEALDGQMQRTIADLTAKIREEDRLAREAEDRVRRIEQALVEGTRLLDEDRPTEAVVRFDQVLDLNPTNARANEGKRVAQDRIRAANTRQMLRAAFDQGKALFDAGQYEKALPLLTDAAADPANVEARAMVERARHLLESVRQQKELRVRIESLIGDAERLLNEMQYPEAWVKLDSVIELDPTNVRAQERRAFAERMTADELLDKLLPNRAPVLTFLEPPPSEVEGATFILAGVATDDRGLARVEFRVGNRLVAQQQTPSEAETGEFARNLPFRHAFRLDPGMNEISITAVDNKGLAATIPFRFTRRLRFYETRAFLPSAFGAALGLVGLGFAVQHARRARAVRNRFNPYIAGAPVRSDEMFFGREKLLARILNVLHHNSLMITGERRIGKTTFLYHLKNALEQDTGTEYCFFPVLTDLQGVAEEAFFHAVMTDVVESLKPSPETLASLRFRPDHTEYDGRDLSHDVQRIIDELKTRTPKHVKLALLIDEVDVLNEYSERTNQRLRSIFMKTFSEHLVAIMSGVGIRRIWKSEGSPWYNFFDEIELAALSREEAEALIREPVRGVFHFDPEAVERILEYSQLKPYLVQKLCIHAVNRMLESGRTAILLDDVEAARAAMRFEVPEPDQAARSRHASM